MLASINQQQDLLKEKHRFLERIFVSDDSVIPGWMFIVEYGNKFYLMVNKNDLEIALKKPFEKIVELGLSINPRIFDIPISTDRNELFSVMDGVFVWAGNAKTGAYGGNNGTGVENKRGHKR